MTDSHKITLEEFMELFGGEIPNEAWDLVFNGPGDMTVGEARERLQQMARDRAALAAAPQPAPDQAEDESRVCLHCGVQTRARFDPCWRCGLWHSRLVADGYKRLQARVDRSAPQPATPGERMIRAAEEAVAIARGEAEPASVYPAPQPAPEQGMTRAEVGQMLDGKRHDREALVEAIREACPEPWISHGGAADIADALLARGLRLAGGGETMAWGIVRKDGEIIAGGLRNKEAASNFAHEGERVVRVAIRVLSLIHISEPTRPY